MNNIHFAFGKYLLILFTIMSFLEQGKNTDRSDARDLWFLFQFLYMIFPAMNFKAHKNFVLVIKNT